jgi:hypothetical protein
MRASQRTRADYVQVRRSRMEGREEHCRGASAQEVFMKD